MAIKKSRPPNYEKILAVLPGASQPGVIFAYAPDIYVPSGNPLPDSLIAHEMAHIQRQEEMGVEAWWDQYLADPEFRYKEELLAHACEYDRLLMVAPSRNVRRTALKTVSKRLAAGLYSTGVSVDQAAKDIAGVRDTLRGQVAA